MRSSRSRWLFAWLFVVDAVLAISYTLVGQWATIGFDPVFYNPILIAAAALVSMVLGSYVPFLVLYKAVFAVIVTRVPNARPAAVCWGLFLVLSAVVVGVAVVSFGDSLALNDVLFPLGLSTLNVFAFFLLRVRAALPSTVSEGQDLARFGG